MASLQEFDYRSEAALSSGTASPLLLAWALIAVIALVDFAGLAWANLHLRFGYKSSDALSFAALFIVNSWIRFRLNTSASSPKQAKRLDDLSCTIQWMFVLAAFAMLSSILSELSVHADFPLIDTRLDALDHTVGFDWYSSYEWIRRHRSVLWLLAIAYNSGLIQTVVVPLILGMVGNRNELIAHIWRLIVATIFCLLIATFFPASSAFLHFHITDPGTASSISTFFPLRDGALRTVDLSNPQGLVSMPSMHTTMAILFIYSLRKIRFISIIALVLNLTMIAAAPALGGHYLPDIVGGMVLAWFSIVMVDAVPRLVYPLRYPAELARG